MFKNIRNKIIAVFALAVLSVPVFAGTQAFAAAEIENCLGGGATLSVGNGDACPAPQNGGGTERVNTVITTIVNIFSLIVGIVSVIMIIFGGFKYITSGGDSGKVSEAKNTIIYAVIGLVVVAFAQFIVQFVLDRVTQQ
jgi:hypothetical protein